MLVAPGKLAGTIDMQTVRCVNVKCGRDFAVPDAERIADGPYEV